METSLKFDDILAIAKDICPKNELVALKIFINKTKNDRRINIENVINTTDMYLKDGVMVKVPKEEKKGIFGFLIENNVPINEKTYLIAYNRYLKGELVITPKKGKILVK